jgi:hypothetical protein
MTNIVRNIGVPVTVDGSIRAHATFTVTVTKTSSKLITTITYEGKFIDELEFAGDIDIENVIATIKNKLTPELPVYRS